MCAFILILVLCTCKLYNIRWRHKCRATTRNFLRGNQDGECNLLSNGAAEIHLGLIQHLHMSAGVYETWLFTCKAQSMEQFALLYHNYRLRRHIVHAYLIGGPSKQRCLPRGPGEPDSWSSDLRAMETGGSSWEWGLQVLVPLPSHFPVSFIGHSDWSGSVHGGSHGSQVDARWPGPTNLRCFVGHFTYRYVFRCPW